MSRVPPEAEALSWAEVDRLITGMIESERYLMGLLSQQPLLMPGASDRDAQREKSLKNIAALEKLRPLAAGFVGLEKAEALADMATASKRWPINTVRAQCL